MVALVMLLLGILAIGAVLTYYLIMMMLVAAGFVLAIIAGISLFVADQAGPVMGVITFILLFATTLYGFNRLTDEEARKHGDPT